MIGEAVDRMLSVISPTWAVKRAHARKVLRSYQGAEANRISANKRPQNKQADQELAGRNGADQARAWSRALVRDNAYAWGVVDTIVSSTIGCGIVPQSVYETVDGDDLEDINDARDKVWHDWSEVADINGRLTFAEIQQLAMRELVEAGEVLVRKIRTPGKTYKGITRPVPFALELIEADRLASDKDTYAIARSQNLRIVRGVEVDDKGKVVAYWIYPQHPNDPTAMQRLPERVIAADIMHLFRQDRVGQTRGVTWFAPAMQWIRDLGVYVDNELQASAVAACFTVAIKTDTPIGGLRNPDGGDQVDDNGNVYDFVEPGMVMRLSPGETAEGINPGRPNTGADVWVSLILRGIAVGTGLSYEVVARDYSRTSYSSSRTSQLEDRRRFRCWQQLVKARLCQPVWDAFCDAAAIAGVEGFPSTSDLLTDRRLFAPVEWQTPDWEWVDPRVEQISAQSSIESFMSDYQTELGSRGKSYRAVFYQRAKEEKLRKQLGLKTKAEIERDASMIQQGVSPQSMDAAEQQAETAASGEMLGLSRLQYKNNRKAIEDILGEVASGQTSEIKATALLSAIGLGEPTITALLADAADGVVDTELPEVV